LSAEEAEIASRIIKKDLRGGFAESTVNKAVPKAIPVYPCLLATPYSDKALAKIVYPAYSQIKADGMRANLLVNSTEPLRGRSGKTIDLLDEFVDIPSPTKVVLDGELRMVEDDGSWMDRKKGNGLLNKSIRGTITPDIAARARFIAWDIISWEEFSTIDKKAKKGALPYHKRWEMLEHYIAELDNDKIILSENVVVNSLDEAQEHFADAVSRGEEGIIVKNINHRWENRRSEHLVKFKVVEECDLEVIGWSYGEDGKRLSDTMGTLTAASSDRKVIVDVPGYSDELRAEIFENIDDYMGRIITVMYNERISSKTRPNTDSVFLPRFVEFREDKEVADSSEDIK
jgi:DNA ligase-1